MNILFISSYYLFKETRFGGSKRLYLLAKELEKNAEVSVLCLDGCKELAPNTPSFSTHPDFARFLYLPWTHSRGGLKKIFSSGIVIADIIKANAEKIKAFLGNTHFDAAFCAFPLGLSFIGTVLHPQSLPIFYCEDDLFLEKLRYERPKTIFRTIHRFVRLKQLTRFYRKKVASCTALTAISVQEQEILQRLFPSARIELLGYGIDIDQYPFTPSAAPDRFSVGFIGNYLHPPNLDALHWYLKEVHPAVRNAIVDAKLIVAGHALPDNLIRQYAGDQSIVWLGEVPNLNDFYKRISVFVNPIISGRGMRTKLIEAAAFGKPIVSTRLGAEGLERLTMEIAEDGTEFASCCRRLFEDGLKLATISKRNRMIVEQEYSIEKVGKRLLDILKGTR